MTTKTATRVSKIEHHADHQHGICIACLKDGRCSRLEWRDTRVCGKTRDNLPAVLYPEPGAADGGAGSGVQIYLPDNGRGGSFRDQVLQDAQAAGLDERALDFLAGYEGFSRPEIA